MTDTPTLLCELAALTSLPALDDPEWRKLLTAAERAFCTGLQRQGEHLAARVLAKRAATRAIGWPGDVPWQSLEVRRTPPDPPHLHLDDELRAWCETRHAPVPGVSLTHAAGHAAAIAWLPTAGSS